MEAVLRATVVAADFEDFEIVWKKNVFEGTAVPRKEVVYFGTLGVNFRAHNPESSLA